MIYRVGDPDAARAHREAGRAPSDPDGADDPVRRGVDPDQTVTKLIGDPHPTAPGGDRSRWEAEPYRGHDPAPPWIYAP